MANFKHPGYVYILTNDFLPGSVKIGYTSRSIKERINELSDTGMPSEYRPYFFEFVEDAPAVEEAIHCSLFDNRINMDREFFNIHPESAVDQFKFESKKYRNQLQEDLFNKKKSFPSYLTKDYNNPKFSEFVNLLISNKGEKPIAFNDLKSKLKVSENALKSLIYVVESQPMKILYTQGYKGKHTSDLKYNLYLKFGENQLNELRKKYPKMSFNDFENKSKNVKKPTKKEFFKKIEKTKNSSVELDIIECSILVPMIKYLQSHSIKFNTIKKENEGKPESEKQRLPKRFFTAEQLSKVLKTSSEDIINLITKCSEDDTLSKCIYHFEAKDSYGLHGDFSDKVLQKMKIEQPSLQKPNEKKEEEKKETVRNKNPNTEKKYKKRRTAKP